MAKLDDCYEVLEYRIFESILEDEWRTAMLDIEKRNDGMTILATYWDEHGVEKTIDIVVGLITPQVIEEIHQLTCKEGDRWNRAKFYVPENSRYKMEFMWDPALDEKEQGDVRPGLLQRVLGWFGG